LKGENIMKTTFKLLAIATLVGTAGAQAAVNNPLQPNYYWDKAQVAQVEATGSTVAALWTNPLDPRYYQARAVSAFEPTASSSGPVAITNPLHPQFRRN
jgi:hypothetical protein